MTTQLRNLRPVLTQPEHDFGKLLAEVLSPSRPLHSEEFLRGREEQLHGIKKALYQPGRHVLIHGFRGVGKSSLAQTAAFSIARSADPVIVGCDSKSTFQSVVRDLFNEAVNKNPQVERKIRESGGGFSKLGLNLSGKSITQETNGVVEPSSVSEAVR